MPGRHRAALRDRAVGSRERDVPVAVGYRVEIQIAGAGISDIAGAGIGCRNGRHRICRVRQRNAARRRGRQRGRRQMGQGLLRDVAAIRVQGQRSGRGDIADRYGDSRLDNQYLAQFRRQCHHCHGAGQQ